jgi:RNA polymerase-binding transcription factor DksA
MRTGRPSEKNAAAEAAAAPAPGTDSINHRIAAAGRGIKADPPGGGPVLPRGGRVAIAMTHRATAPSLTAPADMGYRNNSRLTGTEQHLTTARTTMTKADREHFRKALIALRARLTGDVSHLADEAFGADEGGTAGHTVDAVDGAEQELALSLLQNQGEALEDIALALERLEQGTYGRCEECGSAIPRGRLRALPYTRHCVACARKLQQED